MPKLGMEPIRRRQLIEATMLSIGEHGFAETTVARISKAAGVSAGIIHHYFGGKDELLAATMRELLRHLRQGLLLRLERAETPLERVRAIIDNNFAPEQVSPQAINVWLAFWGQVPHVPALARLQRINAGRLYSNLLHAFRRLLPPQRAEQAAAGMAAQIDGLWLRGALEGRIDAAQARTLALDYLNGLLTNNREVQTP